MSGDTEKNQANTMAVGRSPSICFGLMDIPAYLTEQILAGDSVLFLGSGASIEATCASGKHPPIGQELGAMLAKKFLGGKFATAPLSQIGEYAISESSLTAVQGYIRSVFESFRPTYAHKLLPKFRWAGLATTNYDLLVEQAYRDAAPTGQKLKPFIENGDQVNTILTTADSLKYLKLHGCITRVDNLDCPLILSTDQYVQYNDGRSRIFNQLVDLGFEKPVVFIGHSLQDPDIRAVLLHLQKECKDRPRFYILAPSKDPIEKRFLENKRISTIDGTFSQFMQTLEAQMSPSVESLMFVAQKNVSHPIYARFKRLNAKLSKNCTQFLENDVEFVQGIQPGAKSDAKEFYRGYTKGWAPIDQGLDVRRTLGDTILSDFILCGESEHPNQLEVVLVKAHAGAGKSVLLRRIAWDAAKEYDKLVLYLDEGGVVSAAALEEISDLCKERIYLFIDDLGDHTKELIALSKFVHGSNCRITVVAAERVNEWNVLGVAANRLITAQPELTYLSEKETTALIELLAEYDALGTLEEKSTEARMKAFQAHAGRQLLVALHEATLGRPFEDIIEDEYNNIVPDDARRLYLSICVLNRLAVPVRAGVVSRLHGISFDQFQLKFFKPLENVVHFYKDTKTQDISYGARHPVIAEIVFDRALTSQEDRYDSYLKVLKALNIDYSGDKKAFRSMTRGRAILELFPNKSLAADIYKLAHEISSKDAILFHQEGIYEMHSGNLSDANDLFVTAELIMPESRFIKHSRSELLIKMSERARTPLEKEGLLREAASIAKSLKGGDVSQNAYADHTLVKIGLNNLKDLLSNSAEVGAKSISDTVWAVQKHLSDGLSARPGDSYLHSADAELAHLIKDSSRAVSSLRKAFDANPKAPFLAIRLASHYEQAGDMGAAKAVLTRALEESRTDKALHFRLARHLMLDQNSPSDTLTYHLQRSFTSGDSNYEAQMLYGRQLYLNGDQRGAQEVFKVLKRANVDFEVRDTLLYPVPGVFRGLVDRMESYYLLVRREGAGDVLSAQRKHTDERSWTSITRGARIEFEIQFNFHGPAAVIVGVQGS